MGEKWISCAKCTTDTRESESYYGLCFWCTPEGEKRMAEIDARAAARAAEASRKQDVAPAPVDGSPAEDRWWANRDYEIKEIESEDSHVTYLSAREADGSWEYALVYWRHRVPRLWLRFKDGKVVED